jgi:enterochelin esterase-like enzyme/sugar lactone lactonase YvrE
LSIFLAGTAWFAVAAATAATSVAAPPASRPQDAPTGTGQRIFSTGHSFHSGFPPILDEMARSAGFKDQAIVGVSNIGGSKVAQHVGGKAVTAQLTAGNVDVLMTTPIYLPDPGIEQFAELGLAHQPAFRLTMMEFWLPFDNYEPRNYTSGPKGSPTEHVNPPQVDHNAASGEGLRKIHKRYFDEMDAHAIAVNRKLGRQVVLVVPVGQAVIALRERIIAGRAAGLKTQEDLFTDQLGHPKPPLTILMGYCHYAVIYRQSPVGLPVPKQLAAGARTEDLNRLLQELAWDAVIHHPLSGVTAGAGTVSATGHAEPKAPAGTVKTFTFSQSRIYPGTRRGGSVFIPAQYDPAKPACVYVRQDGYNPAEKSVLESLIAAGDMPVTVGVFVSPGNVPAPMPGTQGRRNRCFEYDAVSDAYPRFLVEELLPFVAKEFDLKLSASGNDRCIAGGSSGGIAALNAAWQRPDAFSRVYANSGSFVAFRGGHEFPTLIRKVEAKPIRAYLTTGTHDMVNCAGDWYLLDQEMDQALKFSGYDYFFRAIDGPHVAGWNEFFPEAMRFIWKGWPEPVRAGAGAPRVRDVLLPDKGWTLSAEGFSNARGPACNAKGEVYFADPAADKVYRIGLAGKTDVFLSDTGHAAAVAVGPKGEVYTVSEATGQVLCRDEAGPRRVVATGIPGRYVLARPDGTLYVTGPGATSDAGSRIWRVSQGRGTVVDTGLKHATGLAYRPDQWLLSVADGDSKWVYSFQINDDGTLAHKERYFWLHVQDWDDDAGAESVCYAAEGQMLVATRSGIQVCADDGPTQVILPMPQGSRVLGVCLGGAERNTLFAFCGNKIWKRTVKLHAIGAFSPRTAVHGTPL